jgi:hypothetical protein
MKRHITIVAAVFLFASTVIGQSPSRKCLTHEKHLEHMASNPEYAKKMADRKAIAAQGNKKVTAETVYSIPVVVHVIHNGEAIGVGQNISDAQINSAIVALNNDFRSLNADTLTPSHPFYPLQADIKIEFCLAKQDVSGQATTGIVRYNKGQATWPASTFDSTIKPATIWDNTKYMNIWTTTFGAPDETTLGYAVFPSWASSEDDGLVIGATYFGTVGNLEPGFDKNRTATHEVGHYLGLLHIWGDEECGDDLVSDTPTQEGSNDSYCPNFPHNSASSCDPGPGVNGEMFMNYMDYTLDDCMQLFSTGQKTRMRSEFETYRISLASSNGCSIATNIKLPAVAADIQVYPNPASGSVTIETPAAFGITSISIYNINGVLVSTQISTSISTTLSTATLENGNYLLTVGGSAGVVNKKLVIIQ